MPRRISNRLARQIDDFEAGAVTHLSTSCDSGPSRSLMLGALAWLSNGVMTLAP